MARWIAYLRANCSDLIRPNSGYGDWLAPDNTAQDLIGTAFFASRTDLVPQARDDLGETPTPRPTRLYDQIRPRSRPLGRADGTVGSGSQTGYVLALKFGLVPETCSRPLQPARRRRRRPRQPPDRRLPRHAVLLKCSQDGGRADLAYQLL